MPLSDDEQRRIREEEDFRARARADAEARAGLTAPRAATPRKSSGPPGCAIVIFIIAALILVVSLLPRGTSAPPTATTPAPNEYSTYSFAIQCRNMVTERLKAPATAKFPSITEQQSGITRTPAGYRWRGYVDAQNAFGALIRTGFMCEYTSSTESVSVSLDGQ